VPTEKRAVCIPFEGELERLAIVDGEPIKPGTRVKKDQVLAYMRSDQLLAERAQAIADMKSQEAEANRLHRDRDPKSYAEGDVASAKALAAKARVEELDIKIKQAELRSPIDGVVLSGDNVDKQGAKFEMGKPLFEVGELDALRAEINVNERDLQMVQNGPKIGQVATRSLPNEKFDFNVDRIVPLGDVKEGANTFRVYGKLKNVDPNWRPGMVGEARLDVEKKPWAWIWTHRLVDWVRIKLWM
jgi:multidrug efflux pump subunit AcrA (membrane-fusion protein)